MLAGHRARPIIKSSPVLTANDLNRLKQQHRDWIIALRAEAWFKDAVKADGLCWDCDDTVLDIALPDGAPASQAAIKGGELLLLIMQFAEIMGIPQVITTHREHGLDRDMVSNGWISSVDVEQFLQRHGIQLAAILRRNDIIATDASPQDMALEYDPEAFEASERERNKAYQQDFLRHLAFTLNAHKDEAQCADGMIAKGRTLIIDDSHRVIPEADAMGYATVKVPDRVPFLASDKSDYRYLFEIAEKIGLQALADSVARNSEESRNFPEDLVKLLRRFNEFQSFYHNSVLTDVVYRNATDLEPEQMCNRSLLTFEPGMYVHPGLQTLWQDVKTNPERALDSLRTFYQAKRYEHRFVTNPEQEALKDMASLFTLNVNNEALLVNAIQAGQFDCANELLNRYQISPVAVTSREGQSDLGALAALLQSYSRRNHEETRTVLIALAQRMNRFMQAGNLMGRVLSHLNHKLDDNTTVLQLLNHNNDLKQAFFGGLTYLPEGLLNVYRHAKEEPHTVKTILDAIYQQQLALYTEKHERNPEALALQDVAAIFDLQLDGESLLINAIRGNQIDLACTLLSKYKISPVQTVRVTSEDDATQTQTVGPLASLLKTNNDGVILVVLEALAKRMNEYLHEGKPVEGILHQFNHKVSKDANVFQTLVANPNYFMIFFAQLDLKAHPQLMNFLRQPLNNVVDEALSKSNQKKSLKESVGPGAGKRRSRRDDSRNAARFKMLSAIAALGDVGDIELLEKCLKRERSPSPSPRDNRTPSPRGSSGEIETQRLERALNLLQGFLVRNIARNQDGEVLPADRSCRAVKVDERAVDDLTPFQIQVKRLQIYYQLMREYQAHQPQLTIFEVEAVIATISRLVTGLEKHQHHNALQFEAAIPSMQNKLEEVKTQTNFDLEHTGSSSTLAVVGGFGPGGVFRERSMSMDAMAPARVIKPRSSNERGGEMPPDVFVSGEEDTPRFGKRKKEGKGLTRAVGFYAKPQGPRRRSRSSDHGKTPQAPQRMDR